jgi:alpha-methylacyl-CoA racemase
MTTPSAPLAGIRIVSMALNTPGPLAVQRIAAEGAHVVKIEPPAGDPLASIAPDWYAELHAQVQVERIDLKDENGRARRKALLSDADVFISSQRPSALSRLGLEARTLAHTRWLNIVGERANPEVPGHDLTYLARAGLLRDTMPVSLFADVMGSERAFSAVLLLLRQPPGARAKVGLFDSLDPLVAPRRHGLTTSGGILGGGLPAYGIYRTREGTVAIAALEPHFRAWLYEQLGLPIDSALDDVMLTRTAVEWEAWANANDLPLVRMQEAP